MDVILELEAETLSESRFLMADLTIRISEADFIKMGEFLAEEGSNFEKKNGKKFGRILGRRQSEAHLNKPEATNPSRMVFYDDVGLMSATVGGIN